MLLQNTGQTVSEIAYACGFESVLISLKYLKRNMAPPLISAEPES